MELFGKFFDKVIESKELEVEKYLAFGRTQAFERLVDQQVERTESRICHFMSKLFIPEAAKDTDEKWRFIAQTNKLVQTIEIEICRYVTFTRIQFLKKSFNVIIKSTQIWHTDIWKAHYLGKHALKYQ